MVFKRIFLSCLLVLLLLPALQAELHLLKVRPLGGEQNLLQLGFGFINDAFDLYVPRTAKDSLRTQEIEKQISTAPDWAEQIAQKGAGQSLDPLQAIHSKAQYMADREP